MARKQDKSKAIALRLQGLSYSQIKSTLKVSKSTLSGWLKDYPLSEERIKELRNYKLPGHARALRVERYINTRRKQRENEEKEFFRRAKNKIGVLNDRDLFIAGIYLYWAEGGKSERFSVAFSNTDPAMNLFFIKWLQAMGANKSKIKIRLQLYADMNINKEIEFWSNFLNIPKNQFTKPYVKKSMLASRTYKKGFDHGTCNIYYHNKELAYFVRMALRYISGLCAN